MRGAESSCLVQPVVSCRSQADSCRQPAVPPRCCATVKLTSKQQPLGHVSVRPPQLRGCDRSSALSISFPHPGIPHRTRSSSSIVRTKGPLSRSSASESGARSIGHVCAWCRASAMHARQKVCAHAVVTGSTRAHWQIAHIWCQLEPVDKVGSQSSRESMRSSDNHM